MKKYFVEWEFTDDYGRHGKTGDYEWFDTEAEMENWVEWNRQHNGGYFYMFRKGEGNYDKWERMVTLWEEMAKMKKEIEVLRTEI